MRNAFSLIEVLVVVAVISLLFSIFAAVAGRAHSSAMRVQCQNNLRQIGQGLAEYAARSNGWLFPNQGGWGRPESERWYNYVFASPTVGAGGIFRCSNPPEAVEVISYALNYHLDSLGVRASSRAADATPISKVVVAGEKRLGAPDLYMEVGEYWRVVDPARHGRVGSNLLFLDWHVEPMLLTTIRPGCVDPWDPGLEFLRK